MTALAFCRHVLQVLMRKADGVPCHRDFYLTSSGQDPPTTAHTGAISEKQYLKREDM